MKKRLLILLPVLTLLCGCGVSSNDSSSNSNEENNNTEQEPPNNESNENNNNEPEPPNNDSSSENNDKPSEPNGGGNNNNSSSSISYNPLYTYSEDSELSNLVVNSTGTDEEAILVNNNATLKLDSPTITRVSSSSTGGDNSSFYGVGSAVLTTSGTTLIKNGNISTDAKGGAGVFSYSSGISYIKDTTIVTKKDTSGGIHAAGGGTVYAFNLDVTTNGESSAAIRSDRGGGTIRVDGGSYTSNGIGSPAIYSTADVSVLNSSLKATSSEAICIEGLNSIALFNSSLEGNMQDSSQNDVTRNVIVYQSMSGDSEIGKGSFYMVDSSLKANNGGMFYTTNTESDFLLDNVDIEYSSDSSFLLQATGNTNQRGWGSQNSNGADCNFTARNQELIGDVIYDSISSLDMYLVTDSSLKGAFIDDESYVTTSGNEESSLYIDSTSTWIVTKDSTLTNLYLEGNIVDENGNSVKIVDNNGNTLKEGTSSVKVTVQSFEEEADLSSALQTPNIDTYEVEKPSFFN